MCQKESWGAIFATKEAHSTQRGQPPRMHGPGLFASINQVTTHSTCWFILDLLPGHKTYRIKQLNLQFIFPPKFRATLFGFMSFQVQFLKLETT